MKILAVNWRDIKNPEAGGAEIHLHEILRRLAAKGHEITLISSKYKGCKTQENIDGIKIVRVGNKYLFNFAFLWYYLVKLRKSNFDVIIDDVSKIPLCIPYYVKKPAIAIVHHIHGRSLFRELPFPIALYVYTMERLLIPIFYRDTVIVTVSESTKEELTKMGIQSDNIYVIYNGIGNSLFPDKKSNIPTVIYFGRVKKYKRIDNLIRAFKYVKERIPNAKLIVAGKGDNYKELKSLANHLKLDSAEFIGEVSEEEKIKLLQRAWVFVTTSEKEGWGLSVIEANACGTPAVAYDVPGLRDSIRHGYNGLLVEDGNIKALADIITHLLENNNLREKLSRNAVKWAKRFSWDRSAKKLEKVIRSVVGN